VLLTLNIFSYTIAIEDEIKQFVALNMTRWRQENETWFNIEQIDDKYLPTADLIAAGGVNRRRSRNLELMANLPTAEFNPPDGSPLSRSGNRELMANNWSQSTTALWSQNTTSNNFSSASGS